jgi:N12 class adenine-specific DNA methylase
MPIFEFDGKKYDVEDRYMNDFSKAFPDATSVFERENKRYRVKASDYGSFMKYYQDPINDSVSREDGTEGSDSYLKDLGESFMQGVGSLGKIALSPVKKAADYINESDIGKAINERLGLEGGQFGQWYESADKMEKEYAKRSDRYGGKDFIQLLKDGRYADALGEVFLSATKSAPISLGIMAASAAGSPAAGLALMGAGTASEKYDQLGEENPDMGSGAKMVNSLFTGLFEAGTEYLGAGAAGTAIRQLLKSAGREAAGDAIKKSLMQKSADFMKKHYIVGPIAEEAMEETVNALGEYITDKLTGVERDDNILETMLKSGVYGAAGGAQYSPIIAGARFAGDKMSKSDQGVETPPLLTKSRFAEAEEQGRNMTDPGDIRTASKKMEETRLSLSGMAPGLASTIESYVDDGASEAQVMSLLDGVNADARPLAEDFYADYLRISGLQDRIGEEIDNEVETYVANNITPYVTTNPDGQSIVTTATLSEGNEERPVYVRSIEGDKAVISDNGQDRMVSVKRLSDIVEQDAGHMRRTYEDQLLATRQSELDMTMHHNPKTQLPKPGLIIWNGDNAFILQGQDENGDWIAQPAAYDRETGQVTAKNGSSPAMPITENEILDLQDAIYDAQQVNVVSPEDDNVASADAEITSAPPVEDAINQPTSEIETEGAIDQIAQPSNVENPSMVMREDGTPDFVSSGTDMTLDFLHDKYGDKMPRKIEVTRKSFDESLKKASDALEKAQEAYDDAPIGKEDKAEAALIKARQEYEAIKVEADFWANLDDDIKEASKKPGDVIAKEISVMGDPMSGEELAAMMLANGAIKLTRDTYKKETGAGNNETARMFGLFASPEKGGVNIERAGEILELADKENGTNFFDENDTNAGRDAIIEVLSSARTRGDLIDYVKRNREAIAERERQAEYNDYAEWCEENYHMSPEEYEAYEESMVRDFSEKQLTDEERGELDSQIVDEIQAIIDEQNEIDAILAQNKPIENENIEGNDESGGDGLREGGGEVLPREQLDQTGGTGEVEGRESAGPDIDRTDGATQEGSSRGVVPFVAPSPKENETPLDYAERIVEAKRLHEEELKVDTNPTEAQKEAGNYKKGHIKINGFDVTIEQPAGSVRSGKDASGKEWSQVMNNTYGYIRGTEGVDGDHIDVFIGPDINSDMVYVVDQVNTDGSFDEHKVMMGFSSLEDARSAYLSNYEDGWQGLGNITGVALDEFKKWIDSSIRKTKPFSDYKMTKENPNLSLRDIVESSGGHIVVGNPGLTVYKKEPVAKKTNGNKLVSEERYEELKKRMRAKLGGQMNMGIDPEILAIGTEMAVYHIEKGLRKFSDYSKAMIDDLGDAIRPYLKSFYNGARDLPEVGENGWDKDMTTYEDVRSFDVANFDKPVPDIMDAAETVVRETEIAGQASAAKKKIKNSRKKQTDNKDKPLPLYGNDLFTPNNIKDNEQGNSRADQGVGRKAREEDRGSERGGDRGGVHGSDVLDTERGRGIPISDSDKRPVVRNQNNFSFPEKGIELPSGDMSKLKANIEAIETLKDVEDGQGKPTPEQQAKMSRYVGWGGLAEALNEGKYNARDNNWTKDRNWNDKYLRYYEKLKSLLSKEEFDSAVRSTTTSHYTPSEVVESLWGITEKLGFKGGNISEPAMGIGNIIGMMPRSISENSSISGFEIDSLSGRMAKALYPDANIKVQGYEKAFSPNSKDLVITNVPFGKNAPYDKVLDKQFKKKLGSSYNLHNYFILKGLLELKEGGLGVFVTSSATMDGADSKFREYVSGNGYDLVGAIRLPNDAFQKGAGTSVTADIVIFRKRKYGEPSNGIGFTTTTQIGEGTYMEDGDKRSKPIMVNEYFSNHPDMMLGDMMTAYDAGSGGLYSGASQTLKAKPGADLSKELFNAIDNLPKNILSGVVETKGPEVVGDSTLKDGTITVQNGNVFVLDGDSLKPIKANPTFVHNGKTRKIADAVNDYNDIKKNLYDLIHDEQTKGVDPEPARKRLNKVYDAFVSKYGTLNRNKALDDIFAEDVEHGLPFSLETVRRVPSTTGKSMVWEVSKADGILNKRVSYPFELPTKADNVLDAVNISKSYKGNIDIPYISEITGMDEENVTNEILEKGIAYRDPVTGNIIDKSEYLSGNVKDKLVEARAALEDHPEFQKNVDDLEAVQPERIPYGEISYRLGTTWIPSEFINNFADNVLGISYANANFIPEIGEYILDKRAFITDYAKAGQFKTERMDAIDVFKAALNQRKPKVYDEIKYYEDGKQKTRRVVNEQETQAVAEKISDMSDKFVEYIDSKTMFHGRIEDVYNDKYNNYVLKKYDKPVFEHYPNANKNITLRDHQSKAAQRCLSESTLLAHQVGTGKTFTMITSAMEMRRLGIAKKPMIVVQNATLEDFVRDFYKLYPSAKILSPTKEERNADNRTRLFNLIATGDFDAIVVPQSFMAFIPDSEERKKAYIQKRIDDFEEAIDRIEDKALQERLKREAKSMRDSQEGIKKGKNVKGKAKTAETITAKTERILDRRTDNVMTFEQMGVDALFIDEAHNYKKIGFPSKMSNVKGIDTSASQRANSMLLKAQWISENNGGRNVVLATGTPITNTMAEVWTMMNFVAPDILDAYNINSFDEFATTFGTVEPSLEFTATGNFKIAERFKSYTNVPELIKAFRSHTDVVLTEDVKEFKEDKNIPKLKDNKMTNVIVEKNEDLEDVMQTLIKELEDYNKLTGKEKKDKSALPLVVFSKAKQAAIDLRLLNPTFPDNPDSKTNKVVDNVLRLYKESDKDKGTQLIFCDSYQSPSETPKMDLFDVDLSVPQFNLYNDIKEKLIKGGIPSNQIAIVGNYEGERRNALFDKVRNGDVRILIGSTEKMGVGVNVQDRLFALHHIDAPIRPMDFEQRNGRILRQGNLYATWDKPVNIVTYGVKGTLDATAYDRLRIKQNFINQMMKGDISSRVMEEQDDSDPSGMTFSEMAATLSGDKTAQLLFVAQNKLKKLQNSKRSDLNSKSSMRDSISKSKLRIQEYNSRKDIMERNANIVKENFPDGVESVTVKGNTFSDGISNELTPIIDDYYDRYTLDRNTPPLKISLNGGKGEAIVHFNEGMMVYSLYLGKEKLVENRDFSGGRGLMASIDRQLGIPAKSVSDIATKIKAEENKIAGLEEAVKKPWGKEDELNAAQAEVNDLQRQLVEKAKAEDIQLESTLDVDGTLVKEEGETRFRFMGVDTTNNQDNVSSIESSINDWSNKLNTPVRVIHDVDDITDTDENMLARKRDSKGWYDTSTGEIVIVSPNSTSVGDAQRTFLHEVVGHHGLRELFGDDFDTFLDNVYRNANEDILKNIIDRTKGNPLNLREATEEYIAELAERGFDNKAERSLWEKIKDSFLDMLRKAGISLDFKLSDNDLRYILWRSYKNLEQGNLMDVAEDIVMRNRLGLNNINLNENGSIERDIEPEKGKQPSETKGTGRELETIEGVDENGNESERDHIDKPRGVENSIDGTENATDRNGRETDGQVDNDGDQLDGGDTGDRNGSVRDGIGGDRTVIGRAGSENKGRGVGESVREKTDDFSFAEKTIRFRENARNESVLFADNDIQVVEKQVGSAKDQYERTLSTSSYQFQEAFQDSMLGLKTLQDAVAKATRSRILDYENAYMAENALSSVNEAEFNAYRKAAFEPILKAMSRLEKMGSSIDEIRDYLITKHGIERNREMAVKRALSQNSETYKSLLDEYIGRRNEIRENGRSWEEQQSEMDRLAEEYGANLSDDFSGFTSMYPNEDNTGYDPDSARRYVLDYESRYDTSELSASVKRATDAILAKQRDSGLMSQNTFESISDMYQFYVPLRGWEETTADEVYAYLTSESQTFNAPIKTVVGRKSKADDPIATIANMAESGIMQGNRNLMKQKFLTMVQNHKTDLVSVSEMWVRLDEASGEWIAVFPDIPSNANPEQVESIVESFNKRMEELSNEKGSNVRRSRDAIGIPYKILPKDLKEHQVIVKRAGKEYVLTINGNPRAAQALNGLTNPDNTKGWFGTVERYAGWLNRNLAANFTTRNPNFMVSNFLRDALYSNTTVWVKESPVYAWKFNKNFAMVNPINMYRLVKGYENGTLDMSDPLNKAYHDFVMRGGETGYTNLRDVEAKKKAIQKELRYSKQKVSIGKALKILGEWMDLFNKSVENCARFAAFITSREMGRSMDKSIYDAKEISVNFNKKGAGSKFLNTEGQTKIGNASAFTSGLSRSMYVFWNAGVQGMYNFGRLAKDNPKKFLGLASSFYLLGTIMPMIAAAFGDDEDDDYYDLPEYVRRNNICFRNGGGNWITIPMPIELRAIYGLGEMSSGIVSGKEKYTDKKMAMKIAEQMSQVLPLDMMEGGGGFSAFVPSSVKPLIEAGDNKDWTGLPLYKDNDFNKGMPEWTKAFKSVDPAILAMTKYANELTGGNKYSKGDVNLNPAIIEHILDGYFGGIEATRSQLVKSAETAWGSRDFDWRNIPVGNRLIKSGDERTKKKAIDNAYYENLEEMDKIALRLRGYEKELDDPKNDDFEIAKYQKLLNDLEDSEEYERYEVFMDLNSELKSMMDDFKESGDDELEKEMYELKAMMNEIAKVNK